MAMALPAGARAPARGAAGRTAPRGRLTCVELGRGLAALAVVVFHADASAAYYGGPHWWWALLGQHGVDFFFVLSGFIIFTAHRDDLGRPERARDYALKRVFRLLPLLWAVTIGWALVRLAAGAELVGMEVWRALLLWPSVEPTMPVVVWTLRHEAVFYAAFAVLLVRPRWGAALFAAWGAAALGQAALVAAGRPIGGVASFFLSAFTLDFLFGAAVAWAYARGRLPRGGWVMPAALAAVVAAFWLQGRLGLGRQGMLDYVSAGATFGTMILGLGFAALLVGLLAVEERRAAPGWAVALGAASYATYLVHTPVNSVMQHLARLLPEPVLALGGGHALLTVAGVAVGVAVHRVFEAPVARALRRRWLVPAPARTR